MIMLDFVKMASFSMAALSGMINVVSNFSEITSAPKFVMDIIKDNKR